MFSAPPCEHAFICLFLLFILCEYTVSSFFVFSYSFYLLAAPAFLAALFRHKELLSGLPRSAGMLGLAAFFGYLVLHSLLLTEDSEGILRTIRHVLLNGLFVLMCVVVFARSQKEVERLAVLLKLTIALTAFASLAAYVLWQAPGERLEAIGQNNHPILGANVYAMAALASAWLLLRGEDCSRQRLLSTVAVGLATVLILLTQSRGAILSYLLSMMALLFLFGRYRTLAVVLLAAGLLLTDLFFLYPDRSTILPLDGLYQYVYSLPSRGDSHRLGIWAMALEKIAERPWNGYGMRAEFHYGFGGVNPHNIFLSTAYYTGVPGMLLLLLPVAWSGLVLLFKGRNPYAKLALALLIHAVLACFTDQGQPVKSPSPLWLIFWLPLALAVVEASRRQNDSVGQA